MTATNHAALVVLLVVVPGVLTGQERQGLDPASLLQPLGNSWPTYSGDYTGRRYSRLAQVTTETVKRLTLAWTRQIDGSVPDVGEGGRGGARTTVGGEGTGEFVIGVSNIKGAILQVDDLLYVTAPDHVWALDARDGGERWHYFWKTRGGPHIGNRGAALWHDYLFFGGLYIKIDSAAILIHPSIVTQYDAGHDTGPLTTTPHVD